MRWPVWLWVGAILQALGMATDRPLTGWMRLRAVSSALGSSLVGGLLVWMLYHWTWDLQGLDGFDVIAFVVGAYLGFMGWNARKDSI
jgi:hypothetical protein